MDILSKDDGIITVLLLRLNQQRLPRANNLYEKVSNGGLLDDTDIHFLDTVYYEAKSCHRFCRDHPEYNDLFARVAHFYNEIATAALENEKR